jgi:predicted oxidoreductase
VHDWLVGEGLRFMPAVNWVERGRHGDGNSLPRYHMLWGTARELVLRVEDALRAAGGGGRLRMLYRHRVLGIDTAAGRIDGVHVVDEAHGGARRIAAPVVVLAMGGVNGDLANCIAHWPAGEARPATLLNGAHPHADGRLHAHAVERCGAVLTHAQMMWNYAAGIPHPYPHFPGHGLSLVPCKSALWLDHRGRRIGPEPLVTGYDTNWLCRRVAAQERPWTWHLLNRRIARRELAVSGSEHNPSIRDRKPVRFLKQTLLGSDALWRQLARESDHVLVDDSLAGLAAKMNALTASHDVDADTLEAVVDAWDANFAGSTGMDNDDQIRRIRHARQWRPDRLRTCAPAPLRKAGAGPWIAFRLQLVTRKSLGGLRTDLGSRVLDAGDRAIAGLYCVGEAAGFGGGGASGKRSLEGSFLPGCILTARAAARSILTGG